MTSVCVTWVILPSMQSTCQYHSSRQVPALVLASCCGIWPTWNCGRGQSCPLLNSFRSDSKNKIYHDTLINSISRCTWGICTQIRDPPQRKTVEMRKRVIIEGRDEQRYRDEDMAFLILNPQCGAPKSQESMVANLRTHHFRVLSPDLKLGTNRNFLTETDPTPTPRF